MSEVELSRESNLQDLYNSIYQLKKDAFGILDTALNADSETPSKNPNLLMVIDLYEDALAKIKRGIDLYVRNASVMSRDESSIKLKKQLEQMREQTMERLDRLYSIRNNNTQSSSSSNVDKSSKSSNVQFSDKEYIDLGDELLTDNEFLIIEGDINANLNKSQENRLKSFAEATEIFRIDNGVEFFYIATDGSVSSSSEPQTLSIYAFSE